MDDAPDTSDLSPEQQMTFAVLCLHREMTEALAIVREDRLAAYTVGAYLSPVLLDLASKASDLLNAYLALMREATVD